MVQGTSKLSTRFGCLPQMYVISTYHIIGRGQEVDKVEITCEMAPNVANRKNPRVHTRFLVMRRSLPSRKQVISMAWVSVS